MFKLDLTQVHYLFCNNLYKLQINDIINIIVYMYKKFITYFYIRMQLNVYAKLLHHYNSIHNIKDI